MQKRGFHQAVNTFQAEWVGTDKKNTVWYVNGWWVGTSKEYRRKLDMDMIGMVPHYFVYKDFVYKDFTAPKRVAHDLWTGTKVTVTYESETRWDKTRLPRQREVAHLKRRQITTIVWVCLGHSPTVREGASNQGNLKHRFFFFYINHITVFSNYLYSLHVSTYWGPMRLPGINRLGWVVAAHCNK